MKKTLISPKLKDNIILPPSKAHAHRVLIASSLSKSPTKIKINAISKDIEATINAIKALGANVEITNNFIMVYPNICKETDIKIDIGDSASTLRFMIPIFLALSKKVTYTLGNTLKNRPIEVFLNKMPEVFYTKDDNTLSIWGKITDKKTYIGSNISSQFISGYLFALPLLKNTSTLCIEGNIVSAPYINFTIDILNKFGISIDLNKFSIQGNIEYISPKNIEIEKDWGIAAFFLSIGAIKNGITLYGLNPNSMQADREIIDILKRFGAKIYLDENKITVTESELTSCIIDATNIPDLVPPISILASMAKGQTIIQNIGRLRFKESNRMENIEKILKNFNVKVENTGEHLIIEGQTTLYGNSFDTYNDHRMAMLIGSLSLLTNDMVEINNFESVNKSYIGFWKNFF